jgi:hypothetical protein
MIEPVETLGDIRFDEPGGPGPGAGDLLQRGVAAFAGTETVRPVGELWLVVCLQQETNYLADEFVRPGRQAERPEFAVLFRVGWAASEVPLELVLFRRPPAKPDMILS